MLLGFVSVECFGEFKCAERFSEVRPNSPFKQEGGIESNYVNPKRDVCRYGSADSGFADSALSLSSSSATWSGDESSLDDSDSSDTRNNRRYSATVSEVFFENNEELRVKNGIKFLQDYLNPRLLSKKCFKVHLTAAVD